jgi:NADH-quinone oxidoreductase subunit A
LFSDFLVVLVFLLFGIAFVILNIHVISKVLRRDAPGHVKGLSYECGEPAYGSSFIRFDIRFYVIALVFLVFDVEVVFLVPWAVALKDMAAAGMGMLAFGEAAIFVAILSVGLAYVWAKGDIEWIPRTLQQARETQAEGDAARAAVDAEAARSASDRAPVGSAAGGGG